MSQNHNILRGPALAVTILAVTAGCDPVDQHPSEANRTPGSYCTGEIGKIGVWGQTESHPPTPVYYAQIINRAACARITSIYDTIPETTTPDDMINLGLEDPFLACYRIASTANGYRTDAVLTQKYVPESKTAVDTLDTRGTVPTTSPAVAASILQPCFESGDPFSGQQPEPDYPCQEPGKSSLDANDKTCLLPEPGAPTPPVMPSSSSGPA